MNEYPLTIKFTINQQQINEAQSVFYKTGLNPIEYAIRKRFPFEDIEFFHSCIVINEVKYYYTNSTYNDIWEYNKNIKKTFFKVKLVQQYRFRKWLFGKLKQYFKLTFK